MKKRVALSLMLLLSLGACRDCLMLCYNPMEIQIGYVDQRDNCQDVSENTVQQFLTPAEQSADPKSRNTVLLAIFSQCMQSHGWGVSSPKMDAVVEKYGEARFAALLPKKKRDKNAPPVEEKRMRPTKESGIEGGPNDPRFQNFQGRGGNKNTRAPVVPYWQDPPNSIVPPAPIAPDKPVIAPSALGVGATQERGAYQPSSAN